ncbi:transcriptional regulator [Siminovitchia terrae]|uniref:Helix-turn-helix domain-containing protein n=1 Tax=Siminovitchia terrae TaxID=1914933 RepID=A0A429XD22_SIMTE|nr:helix-turn-helix domain-containing protein [Siminovitchia terrae]RST61357.1 helix-turn-helix domain-containing protein [Siminovitchia terrae]GIN89518.1 transcriptional regulator [Siminovitchia terrae]GIN96455.1 transcriptional regulator [Siminovitchia terrae]
MIGLYIKELREKRGFSLSKLALKAGISKSYLSYIERDMQKNPSLQVLSKIARPLGVSVEQLLQESTQREIKLDREWQLLVQKAIHAGMRKEDFLEYYEFIRFKNRHKKR